MIKKLFSKSIKIKIHLFKNSIRDFLKGDTFNYAKSIKRESIFLNKLTLTQKIQQTKSVKEKITNFAIAIKQIERIEIQPNELFSFWKAVGNPSKKRGFKESRSIINGKLAPTVGGGLCQLSGLIYYISLKANLQIIERYNHSSDIYTDETRFTPLGSDASVVYGYKDLKIKNNFATPITFNLRLTDNSLTIELKSMHKIVTNFVTFKQATSNVNLKIITYINDKEVAKSIYKNK